MVDDIPEHDPAVQPLWDVRCSDCGKTSNPPTVVVAEYPDPTIDDPRESRRRCQDCYAEVLREATSLGPDAARVVALQLAGYSHDQISFVIGKPVTQVERLAKQARDEHRRAQGRSEHIEAVFTYL